MRRLEACQSPVWDTGARADRARATRASRAEHPALRARGRLAARARRSACAATGRCAARSSSRAAGPSSSRTTTTPTSTTPPRSCSRCARAAAPGRARRRGGDRARRRAGPSACSAEDGGWAAFDADNTRALCRELPVLRLRRGDRSAERRRHRARGRDARARGPRRGRRARARGARWLLREQEPDGSWFGRWGANHVYGTGAVVPALVARGHRRRRHPAIRRAVRWLEAHQNADGGWGEDLRSYARRAPGAGAATRPPRRRPGRCSRCSRRASARRRSSAASPGWSRRQRADGDWDEPQFTGTGFPGDFYINYHLYRLVFPMMALGRFVGCGLSPARSPLMGVPISPDGHGRELPAARRSSRGRAQLPLIVLMLEPLFRCNLACAGCGKIQYPRARAEAAALASRSACARSTSAARRW